MHHTEPELRRIVGPSLNYPPAPAVPSSGVPNGTSGDQHKGRSSIRTLFPQMKPTKPFSGLFNRFKRRPKKSSAPPLDFAEIHSKLLIELAYTANLVRQTIRPDNRDHLVNQLNECVRLVRMRVASGAACIQPGFRSSTSSGSFSGFPPAYRFALDKLSRFYDAYLNFTCWIHDVSVAQLHNPLTIPSHCSVNNSTTEGFALQKTSAVLSDRGHRLFAQFKNASLEVFDSLKAYGFTTLIDPGQLEGLVNRGTHLVDRNPNEAEMPLRPDQTSSSESHHCCILTDADRALLAKLWSHVDAALNTNISPPPKPPLPSVDNSTDTPPTFSSVKSNGNRAIPIHDFTTNDPDFAVYLNSLADAVRPNGSVNTYNNTTIKMESLSRPPLPPNFTRKSSVDLNAPDRLNFPLADDSDASDTDHETTYPVPLNFHPHRSNNTHLHQSSSLSRLTDAISPLLPAQPPSQTTTDDVETGREFWAYNRIGLESDSRSPVGTNILSDSPMEWSISHPANPANPLDDQNMQDNIAILAMRLQRVQSESGPLQNPLFFANSECSVNQTLVDAHRGAQRDSLGLPTCDATQPTYFSELKADTEDDSELIEANGKKYRRHFQRHITIERHKIKQLVVAPTLPDGSGPDWSRAVFTVDQSTQPVSSITSPNRSCMDIVSDSILGRESGAFSGSVSSDLDHGCNGSMRPDPTAYPVPNLRRNDDDLVEEVKMSDDSDWDSDGPPINIQTSTPPPKPPLPLVLRQGQRPLTSYMFRFGSSHYDDPERDSRLSCQLVDLFRTNWHKQETALGPHERTKTISYVEHYAQQNPVGELVRRSTCVQHTCTVRMVGGLDGLRARRGLSVVSLDEQSETTISSSSSPETWERKHLIALNGPDSVTPELPQLGFLDTSIHPESYHEDSVSNQNSPALNSAPAIGDQQNSGSEPSEDLKHLQRIVSCTAGSEILGLVRADDYLIWDESENNNTEVAVHAGCVDALIVYLTSFGKLMPSFFLFYETFLFTYRAFISPDDLIERLIHRYVLFRVPTEEQHNVDEHGSGIARDTQDKATNPVTRPHKVSIRAKVCISTASTLVSVVSRLKSDLTDSVRQRLAEFSRLLTMDTYVSLSRLLSASIEIPSVDPPERLSTITTSRLDSDRPPPSRTHSEEQVEPDPISLSSFDRSPTRGGPSQSDHRDHPDLSTVGVAVLPPKPIAQSSCAHSVSARSSIIFTDGEHHPAPIPPRSALTSLSGTLPRGLRRKSASPAPYGTGSTPASILIFGAQELAEQLTYLEAKKYYQIKLSELLDIPSLECGKAPSVAECALHFSSVCNWATFQILSVAPTERDKLANRFLDVMESLHKLQNYSSYLSILCAFMLVPESLFARKTRNRLSRVKPYMQPPYFSEYRRELEAAQPPFIPYLGLMMQHLIMLAQAHPLWHEAVPDKLLATYHETHGRIVNFWRCWKHFLIIHFIVKQEKMDAEKARYHIKPNPEIIRFLNDFKDSMPEADLRRLANRMRREAT